MKSLTLLVQLLELKETLLNSSVLISNQVCSDPGAGAMFVQDPKKPIGGHVLVICKHLQSSLIVGSRKYDAFVFKKRKRRTKNMQSI